jgi:hypothetical protein
MFRFSRQGPSSLHTGRYHSETQTIGAKTLATAPMKNEE